MSREKRMPSCGIVTGAAGGIGAAFAQELARRGIAVVMIDLNGERLEETKNAIAAKHPLVPLHTVVLDLTRPDICEALQDACASAGVDPDLLINNAGIFEFVPLADGSPRKTDVFIDLHVRAVTLLARWFVKRRRASGYGWLLNMSSMSCWMPMPGLAMYAATKAYIRVMTRALHYEMRDSGIKVMVACPGGIATDLFGLPENLQKLAVGLGVLARPEKFVRKAVDRLLRGRKQYINGWLNRFSIVFVGAMPTPVRMMVKHRLLDKGINRI